MIFKKCPMCSHLWQTREEFLNSPDIKLIGYQAAFNNPEKGLYLFNHMDPNCGSTLSIQVSLFRDLYVGPVYDRPKTGTEECQRHCLNLRNLQPCSAHCSLAYIREIMQLILKKESSPKVLNRQ